MKPKIYLDNNASTAVDPRVVQAVVKDLQESVGNPFGVHSFGQEVRGRLNKARRTIADFLGVSSQEIVFTSGGTEALNMVIKGLLQGQPSVHIVTSSVEHACVYNTIKYLEKQGNEVSFLSPGLWGAITPEAVRAALNTNTRLIVLTAVNNETGVKTDINEIAKIAQEMKIPFVVDGVALLGKEPFTIPQGVTAMCFSGHKIHAPKGVGFAYIRKGARFTPLLFGGPQENNYRAGTENVSGIIGLSEAIAILKDDLPRSSEEMLRLRDLFESGLKAKLPNIIVNGQGPRVVNTSNISFMDVDGETLLMSLDREGVAASHGSACISGALEPSRVLLNMGIPLNQARSTLRFSLSRLTTQQEIEESVEIVTRVVSRLM